MTTREFQKKQPLSILFAYFKPHRGLFALDLVCATIVALIDLAFPMVTRKSMYDLLPQQQYRAFFVVMGVMMAAFIVRALLYYVIAYWGHTFGIRVEADIRRDLFIHVQELDVSFFDHNRTGQLMSRLTSDLFEITEHAHHGPEDLLISTLTIIGALVIMFSIEWRLALVVACILPVFIAVIMSRRSKMGAASRNEKQKTAAINVGIESSLSGIRTARAFANEDEEIDKFNTANEEFKVSKRAFHHEMGVFNATMEFFMTLLSAAVITVGGYLIMRGEINYIDLITFSLYITAFISPVRKLANFSEIFARGFAGLERFTALMRVEPALKDAPDAKELTNCRGEIDVDHVSFSYEGTEGEGVLHDVSVHVTPGEMLAIVGPSGGGKSTLCQLIPRFYEVSGGAIRIDGEDVRALAPPRHRRCAAGRVPLCRHRARKYPLRPPGRDGRGDRRGGEARGDLRRHHGHAARLRHLRRRARHDALRRAEAARVHRADLPQKPTHSHSGRSHERARQRDGGEDPACF